jgi:ubiquinone/menaquinone biosynthesis C-methylase UbiE
MALGYVDERVREVQSFFGSDPILDEYANRLAFRAGEKYVFSTFLHRGKSLLDAGCGTGRASFLLAPWFEPIEAFDIAPKAIERAREENERLGTSVRFRVADATALPFDDASFDNIVFAYNGIEGIASEALRERALVELWRVLRPGGRFVFSTKSSFNWKYWKEFRLKGAAKKLLARVGLAGREWRGLRSGDILHREHGQLVRLHTTNPIVMGRKLRRIGFRVLYFNSEVRLRANETTRSIGAYFDPWDHHFVCEKRGT